MLHIKESKHLSIIPYEDIQSATKNFTTQIGQGGYGPVYRGQLALSDKVTTVAVKRLQTNFGQGVKQFLTEIQLLSRHKHQNLISLVGFCDERKEKFLIYEYAERGSLDKYLKPVTTRCPLTWKQRIKICVDAARGLDHLHNHVAQNERVIHRDVKSSNILLDHNWKSMISDFGLSKIGRANENDTYLITDPCGTPGYCDPAYAHTRILTKESDVYSFGVVLLEVLSGRLCFIKENSQEKFLVPFAVGCYKQGKLNLIVDRDLKKYMNSDSMKVFLEIVFQCMQADQKQRPSMGLVLEKLERALKLIEIEEPPELLELEEVLGLQELVHMLHIKESKLLRMIPYEDIQSATENFTTLIGRGGYGPVYRGQLTLSDKLTTVAVKRLQANFGWGVEEFLTTIQLLSRIKHQNLISLDGFCEVHNKKFLIYEYAERGSLDKYLKPVKTRCPFTWKKRVNICVDAARGLDHLHNHVAQNQRVILHRDVKSANILLDHNWKAMIADYGILKIGPANENETYLITNPCGTLGYCDPSYIYTGIFTKGSDVYSFGVILLEVLCGRLCLINVNSQERFLAPLAQRYYKQGKLNHIVDRDLKNYMNSDSMKVFSEIAFQCLQDDRKRRPSVGLVLEKLESALKLIEIEEAPELLELEEVLGLQKLVETLQMQEACELQELEVALGLYELVETLQIQETCEVQNLVETLELEIGKSLIDYEVIKAIYIVRDTPLPYITRDKAYSHLSNGILVDEGKVWFSITDDGKTQEMISAIKVLREDRCRIRSNPKSRFSKVAEVDYPAHYPFLVNIRTQFLSSNVTYVAYLVCRPQFFFHMEEFTLMYTLDNTQFVPFCHKNKTDDNGWWMIELFQIINLERTVDFKVAFESTSGHHSCDLLFEGILFQPLQKFVDEDEFEISDMPLFSTSNIEWDELLPSDYKRYLFYSNNEMMKTPQREVIFPTKEEAYSILSVGVLIEVEDVGNMWFWITKLDGKKCFMLPPKLNTYDEQRHKIPSTESRFKDMIHLLPSFEVRTMSFDVPKRLLSTDTTYGFYLVYKMPPKFVWKAMVKIKLNMRDEYFKYHGKLTHLSIPQSPVLGPDGVFISRNPINDLNTIQLPKKRQDGWLEVELGNTSLFQWSNMQQDELSQKIRSRDKSTWKSWLPPGEESRNVSDNDTHTNFTLDHRCFSNLDIYFIPIDSSTLTPEFFVQGIEFRPQ